MKLHLGCGTKIIKNYINIDIRENLDCDVVDDIKTLSQFNPSSADEIYACHVLEHFSRHEYITVLKRWYEILKKGGIIKLSVPDLEKVFLQTPILLLECLNSLKYHFLYPYEAYMPVKNHQY